MTTQPRQPAGSRRGGETVAGQWTSKQAPDIPDSDTLSFNDTVVGVGAPCDWDKHTVKLWGLQTTFKRVAETDDAGNAAASVTMGCDPPDMLLLARKGDVDYWGGPRKPRWSQNNKDRRLWCADIARRMLQEGHVATRHGDGVDGIRAAMTAAGTSEQRERVITANPHLLTEAFAKIRGLRLLQSMLPSARSTVLDGHSTYGDTELLRRSFTSARVAYRELPQPPWENTTLSGVPWGSQEPAGHATTHRGEDMFVGEHGDLLWRVLTETDQHGMSPMKAMLHRSKTLWRATESLLEARYRQPGMADDVLERLALNVGMVCAAALYDETAERQLTTGLMDGIQRNRADVQQAAVDMFTEALHPGVGECRWTPEQQTRIRGFIDVIEGLEP